MRRGTGQYRRLVATGAIILAQPAVAQRTGDNAIASAQDAFGTSVGDSSIGIYGETDVRGFSPTDAGNLRIEGLYYDQQGTLAERLQQGSTIRVGISAQSYPFPAPTGIADYTLRKPGNEAIASVGLAYGPWGGRFAEIDAKLPIDGDRLGLVAGAGIALEGRAYGGTPDIFTAGVLARYAPHPDAEFIAFANRYRYTGGEAQPLIFSSGRSFRNAFRAVAFSASIGTIMPPALRFTAFLAARSWQGSTCSSGCFARSSKMTF